VDRQVRDLKVKQVVVHKVLQVTLEEKDQKDQQDHHLIDDSRIISKD
jgi:hypothetical protein